MQKEYSNVDFHKFVNEELAKNGYRILLITEEFLKTRLDDFMRFVNNIRLEYKDLYGWSGENREYFLNGLHDKWKYSYAILNAADEICFVNFTSVYGDILHTHCSYAKNSKRNFGFAKLHLIKLCQTGLESGFTHLEGFWPKNNNGSIILYLKMGMEIQSMRNNKELLLMGNLVKVRNKTYEFLTNMNNKRK
jgi:hypothetical protein